MAFASRFAWSGCLMAVALAATAPGAQAQQAFNPRDPVHNAYVEGNIYFLAYHEAGHLIADMIGQEDQQADRYEAEQDADDIAVYLLMPDPEETDQDDDIIAAVRGWIRSADSQDDGGIDANPDYPDDIDRAARIACLVLGSNPSVYGEFEYAFDGAITRDVCVGEFNNLNASFEERFGDALVTEEKPAHSAIKVFFEDPSAAAGQREAAAYLHRSGILDDVAKDISEFVRLPDQVNLIARSCGPGPAQFLYNPTTHVISACYEAVLWFMDNLPEELGGGPVERATGDQARSANSSDVGSGGARVQRRPRPLPAATSIRR